MKVEQEALIWGRAAAHYGASLAAIANDAVSSFRRKPGLDSLTRIYKENVGEPAFAVLESVLPKAHVPRTDSDFIHVREQLRSHLNYHVLKGLVDAQAVPAELRDTLFSIDLGL